MRLIDADDLIEHAWRDKLDSRELIAQMIENAPTVKTEKTPKEIEQQIHDFADAMYRMGKDDGYKKGIEDTKAQLQKAYENGYADGNNTNLIDEAYQEGLNDAWECARKLSIHPSIGGLDDKAYKAMFGDKFRMADQVLNNLTASEAIQKIKDYEEKQKQTDAEIRVGDEVYAFEHCDLKKIVIYINDNGDVADTLLPSGMIMSATLKDLTKTGKHYSQIEEVLKELRGDEK